MFNRPLATKLGLEPEVLEGPEGAEAVLLAFFPLAFTSTCWALAIFCPICTPPMLTDGLIDYAAAQRFRRSGDPVLEIGGAESLVVDQRAAEQPVERRTRAQRPTDDVETTRLDDMMMEKTK